MKGEKKQTFTYTGYPSIVKKARSKAKTEGSNISIKINEFLAVYVKAAKK